MLVVRCGRFSSSCVWWYYVLCVMFVLCLNVWVSVCLFMCVLCVYVCSVMVDDGLLMSCVYSVMSVGWCGIGMCSDSDGVILILLRISVSMWFVWCDRL